MNLVLLLAVTVGAVPIDWLQKAADNDFETLDNYLPKLGDYPKFRYSTFGEDKDSNENLLDVIDFRSVSKDNPDLHGEVNFQLKGMKAVTAATNMVQSMTSSSQVETTTVAEETTTNSPDEKSQLDPVLLDENGNSTMNRTARQEENDVEGDAKGKEKESQESEEEEEEEENMITGLISAFLGGLSRPDGSVDIEAITGLLGSLSTQNEDGTYDFNGLTELLMSFFGGGGEEGGGSDFGAFLGGLLGAFIKGVANPPGAKGSGIFVGNFLTNILPGLSAPAPTEETDEQKRPQPPLDSGGFISGVLQSLFGSSGSLSGTGNGGNGGGGSKFSLFKAIFSTITSIFSSSSATH